MARMVAEERARDCREAQKLLRKIAGHKPFDTVHSQIARAATYLDFEIARAENIWHGEAHRIDAWEMDILRDYKPEQ